MIVIGLVCHGEKERQIAIEEITSWFREQKLDLRTFSRPVLPGSGHWSQDATLFTDVRTLKTGTLMKQAWPDAKLLYISPMSTDCADPDRELLLPKSHWVCNNWVSETIYRESLRNGMNALVLPRKPSKADVPSVLHLQSASK